ncbi:MarR family winged helix-turn-helix transcriptional regulator [Stenotrophomonas rhizophila]|uniref:MarR family winged helix-turn-helix transcriptional regulator n=1 Tax=Stenotrophomonas rhizophila TaxID=216778 RepID=UPI001E35DDDB|nr:MarR family winged helix-turn-helix transcriptional regulator [Stenotrophomonas rhizophila]MCC7635032.1 winged helix-turn-helix transcriptional regulator [Stenotrophomonas rhizophila]MCC7662591.1 winged helix-turn-helix transcriptional regulator [Stenotrophomonas rhizophila]
MDPLTASPCTCFRLRRAARRLSQIYDSYLAPAGLSLNAYSILRRAPQPRLLGDLADALGMDRTTLTRNLKPLLQAGWLEQRRGEDARQRLIVITPAGKACLRRARPLWQRAQHDVEASFGAAPTARLNALLDQLDQSLPHGAHA